MKKVFALLLVLALIVTCCVAFAACNKKTGPQEIELPGYDVEEPDYSTLTIPSDFKVGLICLHDENSTYDKNFIKAMEEVQAFFGLSDSQVIIATGIDESNACYQKACELAEAGCKVIFADSFGHENFMMQAAAQYPNVQFCHATGTQAHTSTLANFANAFASIYQGRYLAGVAAGLKLQEMGKTDAPKIGYIGAFTYAEVISGYTSFFLGVKSIVPTVTMDVTFTGSWYDETAERESANALIARGCVLISQHADSMGAPGACEAAGIPNVSYNGSTFEACPDTFIVSSRIDWAPYSKYAIAQKINGQAVDKDWVGTIKNGGVKLTNLGAASAAGTVDKIVDVRAKLAAGTIEVFDTANWTVSGAAKTSYFADVDMEYPVQTFTPDTEAIVTRNGKTFFSESEFRSAPYFDITIDGINLLNTNFGD